MKTSPNVLWVYCDELRTDALGCYGNPYTDIQTPISTRLPKGVSVLAIVSAIHQSVWLRDLLF